MTNAMPLTRAQRRALRRAVGWELRWGLRTVALELHAWRRRALAIPDPDLRSDALHAIDCKRGHIEGAALFWTLAGARRPDLVRLFVAYEVIYDYLDDVSERGAHVGTHNGEQLFLALRDALAPGRPPRDYYLHNPQRDDGGFLGELVDACRARCLRLPGFETVRPLLERETARTAVLALNHEPRDDRRDGALRTWAQGEFGETHGLKWYELTAAASQSVVSFALLALATDAAVTSALAEATYDAYFPWWAYAVTMLDSWVDAAEDRASGAHSYVAHYPRPELAVLRLCQSVQVSAQRLLALPHGERHAVLLACMVAMYLSKDSARVPGARDATARIRRSGGTLTAILLPVLRAWRICNGQAAAT